MLTYGGIVYGLVPDLVADHPMPFYIPVWLCGSLFCDLTITVYMTLNLFRSCSQSHFSNTWSMSTQLVRLTIETGFITTTAAIVELVLAIAYRVTLYHVALFYIISKLYANCFLATLNARLVLRSGTDKRKSVAVWEHPMSSAQSHLGQLNNNAAAKLSDAIHIHTQVETDIETVPYPADVPQKGLLHDGEPDA
ncbi:hypothetical protein JVU11DRAFT_7404 [Chiua virens]|nr:hypothetical protein JVU11DRAFT_7404 [Chiua virens]